ncbi:MAG: hypothetical protein RLZ05_523 [Bacteroidota bacterium]
MRDLERIEKLDSPTLLGPPLKSIKILYERSLMRINMPGSYLMTVLPEEATKLNCLMTKRRHLV